MKKSQRFTVHACQFGALTALPTSDLSVFTGSFTESLLPIPQMAACSLLLQTPLEKVHWATGKVHRLL